MRIFDFCLSERRSFLFPDSCSRRSADRVNRTFRIGPKTFLHRVSTELCSSLRNQCFQVLRDATQLWYNFHNSYSILVVAFSSFVGIVAFVWLFVWLFINLVMREQTLISGFTTRFFFVKLRLGRMPIVTRRSRANTFQTISARLSQNDTMLTFALNTSFLRHTSTS